MQQVTPPNLKPAKSLENPLIAPNTTTRFPIRDALNIIVLNHFGATRNDVWFVFEEHEGLQEDGRDSIILSFVDTAVRYSDALAIADKYARAVYGKEIISDDFPF